MPGFSFHASRLIIAPHASAHETGPFDLIGDVHGCHGELLELLVQLGYSLNAQDVITDAPPGRKLVFLGDLVDRGPNSPRVVRLVSQACKAGRALCVPGNHDHKFARAIRGDAVNIAHGLAESLEQFAAAENCRPGTSEAAAAFFENLPYHCILDEGRLVVAHGGMKESLQGKQNGAARAFALYGESTGEMDEFGLPVRYLWAQDYRGAAKVIYGHTPVRTPEWINGTLNIDTGCVFGGALTALRYPELTLHSVPARAIYAQARRPFLKPGPGA